MKKLLPISLIINAVLIIGAVMIIFGPIVGNTFSSVNSELSSVGGSAPQSFYDVAPVENYSESVDLRQLSPQAVTVVEEAVPNDSAPVPAASVERIVIQNADLAIVVSDVEGRMKEIQLMAEQMGGFVVSSSLYQSYTSNYVEVPGAQVIIRVPAEKLEEALEQIKKDVVEVQNEARSGQDVTAEYVDLKSRLKNYEDAETQLNAILKNAKNSEELVNIFNQLVFYREQIEILKGQINYYDEAAALSAISVSIIAEETIQPIEIGGWEPKGVARDAIQDLLYFWQNFVNFLIRFFLKILPQWITIGIPLYLVFIGGRALYRKMSGKKKVEVVEEEKK